MSTVHLRFWAAARDAANSDLTSYPAGTVNEALTAAADQHPRLAQLLPGCAVLRDGVRVPDDQRDDALDGDVELEILPPFAGG